MTRRRTTVPFRNIKVQSRQSRRPLTPGLQLEFRFPDFDPPFATNIIPVPNSTVAKNTNISFLIDDLTSGVKSSTINILVDGYMSVIGGVIQDGYAGSIVANGLGFDISLNPNNNFPLDGYIIVDVDASDKFGNAMPTTSWGLNIGSLFDFPDGYYDEGFEFAGGWDETVSGIPSPSFSTPNNDEAFEFADSWDETVVSIPSPTFASSNLDENFDSGWDGT